MPVSSDSQFSVSLNPGISLLEEPEGRAALVSSFGRFELGSPPPGARKAFHALAEGGRSEQALARIVLTRDDLGAVTWFKHCMSRCRALCLVRDTHAVEGAPAMSLSRTVPGRALSFAPLRGRQVLSRFAFSRREGNALVLEAPTRAAKITVHDWRAAALTSIWSAPHTDREAAEALPAVPPASISAMGQMLAAAGVLCQASEAGAAAEDEDLALRHWEFHDLLFHTRSRMGRHANPTGATFHFAGVVPPPPVSKPPSSSAIHLARPPSDRAMSPMTVGEAIEARCSIRNHGETPISLCQLGEFLYRVDRIRTTTDFHIPGPDGRPLASVELCSRPYPSGGALHELELYLSVHRCLDLEPGLYHYNPFEHSLDRLSGENERVTQLLQGASRATASQHIPQVLITFASRFQRMAWKYSAMAYSATLKNVGALYQTMYLVATAMGLAPCALGNGDSDLFAAAAGTSYYEETSVGEFMLGSRPEVIDRPAWMAAATVRPNLLQHE
jgi:SagB-type dehydrogenase family enzyme